VTLWLLGLGSVALPAVAGAAVPEGRAAAESRDEASAAEDARAARSVRTPLHVGTTYDFFGGLAVGRGIRFDNPYRLRTELGTTAESLSLTATYLDVYVGAAAFATGILSHGIAVHGSFALDGIPQEVVTPSYVLRVRPAPRWGVVGRAGVPIVVEPDLSAGLEAALGGVFYVTAGVGITASVVGSLFFGAATLDTARTSIPILSLEGGAVYEFEVLP
jgi:hypothetical protein